MCDARRVSLILDLAAEYKGVDVVVDGESMRHTKNLGSTCAHLDLVLLLGSNDEALPEHLAPLAHGGP